MQTAILTLGKAQPFSQAEVVQAPDGTKFMAKASNTGICVQPAPLSLTLVGQIR